MNKYLLIIKLNCLTKKNLIIINNVYNLFPKKLKKNMKQRLLLMLAKKKYMIKKQNFAIILKNMLIKRWFMEVQSGHFNEEIIDIKIVIQMIIKLIKKKC